MRPVTSGYRRVDGSRKRSYVCANVHGTTGLCDAPEIDAEVVDSAVVANLDRYLGDFAAWRAAIESSQQGERDRLSREVERAESDYAAARRRVTLIETDYERRLEAGEDGPTGAILPLLERRRRELGRADARLKASRDALAHAPTDMPTDAMLDFFSDLSKAVRGRLDGADTMARINEALHDLFARFELTTTPDGVEIRPVLSAATADRILDGHQDWEYGIEFGASDVIRDEQTGALVSFAEPEEAALFEDAGLRVRPAPTVKASEPIVPPLKLFAAPEGNSPTH